MKYDIDNRGWNMDESRFRRGRMLKEKKETGYLEEVIMHYLGNAVIDYFGDWFEADWDASGYPKEVQKWFKKWKKKLADLLVSEDEIDAKYGKEIGKELTALKKELDESRCHRGRMLKEGTVLTFKFDNADEAGEKEYSFRDSWGHKFNTDWRGEDVVYVEVDGEDRNIPIEFFEREPEEERPGLLKNWMGESRSRRGRMLKESADTKDLEGMTVSEYTMKPSDIARKCLRVLKVYGPEVYERVLKNNPELNDTESLDYDEFAFDILEDSLFEAMNEIAPEGYWFGAHPDLGGCFGYWPEVWE